jgi:hypothetical protein
MSWFPYTNTYNKLALNSASASGWGNLASVADDEIYYNSADNSYSYYFQVEALSPDHIKLKGKTPSFAGVYVTANIGGATSGPIAFLRVNSATALNNIATPSFRSGQVIYYSVDFNNTFFSPVKNTWKVTFWNLHTTGGTNGWKQNLLDIYVCRETDSTAVVFTDGSAIQADDLNKVTKQALFVAEEADQFALFTETANISTKYDKAGGEITGNADIAGTLAVGGLLTAESGINANNTRITNVAVPTENNHVATKQYVDNVVGSGTTLTILDDSITSAKLSKIVGDEAVSTATIKDSAVTTEKLNDGSVTNEKLGIGAVNTNQIFTGISLLNKIAPNTIGFQSGGLTPLFESTLIDSQRPVTSATIRNGAVTTTRIADSAVTTAKILDGNVTTQKLLDEAVTNSKILNYTIEPSKLNAGTNFTYNNTGQFTINKLIIGRHPSASTNPITLDATVSGDSTLTIPYPSSLKIKQTWSGLTAGVVANSGLRYVLTLEPRYGGPTGDLLGDQPPDVRYRLFPEPAYPPRIVIHEQLINQYAQATPNIVRNAWTKRVFNKILFNNTNFFILNANGSFSVTSEGAGTWLIDGFSTFATRPQLGGFARARYISRIAGPGYNPDNNPTNYSSYTTLVKGTYSTIDSEDEDGQSRISGTTSFTPGESYSLEYFYTQTSGTTAGFLGPAHDSPYPDGVITDLRYHPFSVLTLTKVSDNV